MTMSSPIGIVFTPRRAAHTVGWPFEHDRSVGVYTVLAQLRFG